MAARKAKPRGGKHATGSFKRGGDPRRGTGKVALSADERATLREGARGTPARMVERAMGDGPVAYAADEWLYRRVHGERSIGEAELDMSPEARLARAEAALHVLAISGDVRALTLELRSLAPDKYGPHVVSDEEGQDVALVFERAVRPVGDG